MKILLLFLLSSLSSYCFGQEDNRIQLGQVIGTSIEEFSNNRRQNQERKDSALKLQDITKSKYLIEIRMYEDPSLFATMACTILYYDTAFHITRSLSLNEEWQEKYEVEATIPLSNLNPKTIFNQLTKLGIFSLNDDKVPINTLYTLLDNKIVKFGGLCGTTDGTSYRFVTKVGSVFNETYIKNLAQLLCDPSDQMLQRKLKIKDILQAIPEGKLKK